MSAAMMLPGVPLAEQQASGSSGLQDFLPTDCFGLSGHIEYPVSAEQATVAYPPNVIAGFCKRQLTQ